MSADHTLVAVFDSAHVRFFEYIKTRGRLEAVLDDVASGLHHDRRDIDSDRPGRGFSSGGQHHAYESPSDPRKLEKHNFVQAIARAIDAAYEQHKFNALVIVAPERSLGEFRSLASEKLKRTVWREVPKDLAGLGHAALQNHLVPLLQSPAG